MTKKLKITISYKYRHTRAGGYPDDSKTFYEFIKVNGIFFFPNSLRGVGPYGPSGPEAASCLAILSRWSLAKTEALPLERRRIPIPTRA